MTYLNSHMLKTSFIIIGFLVMVVSWIFYLVTLIFYMNYLRENNPTIWKTAKEGKSNFFRVYWYVDIYYLLGLTFKSTRNLSFKKWKKWFLLSFTSVVLITVSFLLLTYFLNN
jgi:hypothetical protein